jgi:hypothetical protein
MKKSHGLRGIYKSPSGKWNARIHINGRREHLGSFAIKEQAAAACDRSARLNHVNMPRASARLNYDSPEDAARAIREARQRNLLRNRTGFLGLIMEAHGPAKYEEDADMVQGQDELRIMVQIGCRCPPHQQDLFLEHVRGFKADEVPPLKWLEQLMAVRAEGLAGGSSDGGRKGKGNGKMQVAADDGVCSSDEDAAWELEDKEQLELACEASFRAAGSTGSSGGFGSGSASSSGGGSSSTARPRSTLR